MQQAATVPNNFVTVFHAITKDLELPLPWPKPEGYVPSEASEPILMYVPNVVASHPLTDAFYKMGWFLLRRAVRFASIEVLRVPESHCHGVPVAARPFEETRRFQDLQLPQRRRGQRNPGHLPEYSSHH